MLVLIIGCGRLGGSLAVRMESLGHDVTIVDHNPGNFESNLPDCFAGRALEGLEIDNEFLTRAGIREAGVVLCVARDESTNMMAADVARKVFNVPRVIVRIDEPYLRELYLKQGYEVISPIQEGTRAVERMLGEGTQG